jgi:tetratricopeptide (TPR) repeat protein
MLASPETAPLPSHGSVEELLQRLREQPGAAPELADALLGLSSREPHPRVKSGLLHHAALLVRSADPSRAANLMREAFRLFPSAEVGGTLAEASAEDPSAQRLFRHGHLVDAVAALSTGARARSHGLQQAIRHHLALGHGSAALRQIGELRKVAEQNPDIDLELPDLDEWTEIAASQKTAREESLAAQRGELADCSDADRPAALVGYAELLLAGDEPLSDAAAVLADALDSGADPASVAPLWVEVARAMGDLAELTRALTCSLSAGEALPTRLQHADELANIPGVDRLSPQAAALALQVLMEVLPDDATLPSRLQSVEALLSDQPDTALETLRQATVRDRDRHGEANASLALAWLARKRGDWPTAERHYRRVRTLAPQETEALDFFESYYRQQQDHKRLLVALSQRLSAAEGREAVRIALEMAQLCEGPLATPDRAVEAYQRVLTIQPDHAAALEGLLRLYRGLGRAAAVRETLERQASAWLAKATMDARAADLAQGALTELADLAGDSAIGGDRGQALGVWRRLLNLNPCHPQAVQAWAEHFQTQASHAELADLLNHAARAETDNARKAELLARLGEVLAGPLADPAGAAAAWSQALTLEPQRTGLVKALRQAAAAAGDQEGVYRSLASELREQLGDQAVDTAAPLPASVAAEFHNSLLQAAELAVEFDRQPAQALRWLTLAALASPGDPAGLALSTRILAGQPQELSNLLKAQLPACSAEAAMQVRSALISAMADLEQWAEAEEYAKLLISDGGDHPAALRVAMRAAVQRGDVDGLRRWCGSGEEGARQFMQEAAKAAESDNGKGDDPQSRYRWWLAGAEVAERELGDHERACELLIQALQETQAAEPGSLPDEFCMTIGRAAQRAARAAALVGAERMAVEAMTRWAPQDERTSLFLDLAELSFAAGEPEEALAMARSGAEDALGDSHAANLARGARLVLMMAAQMAELDDAAAALTSVADWLELANTDASLTEALGDELPKLWKELARCAALRECEWPLVVKALQQVVPADVETLELRERALGELARWPEAIDAAEARADLLTGSARIESLRRAAVLCDTTGNDPARAERLYREVVAHQPDDREAWAGLLAAVRALGSTDSVANVLNSMVDKAPLARDSMAIALVELAGLRSAAQAQDPLAHAWKTLQGLAEAEALSDAEENLLQLAHAQLELPERAAEAAEKLLPVWLRHGREAQALQCQEVLARSAPTGSDARIQGLMGVATALLASDEPKAFELLEMAASEAPGRLDILDRWLELATTEGRRMQAALNLRQWSGIDTATGDTAAALQPAEKAELLRRLANLAELLGDQGGTEEALHAWQALATDPSEPLQLELSRAEDRGDSAACARVLRQLTGLGTEDQRAEAWLRLANTADGPELAAVLQDAVQALPQRRELWTAWLATLRDQGIGESADAQRLADGLRKAMASQAIADEELPTAELELAAALDRCGDDAAQSAAQAWLTAIERDPGDDRVFAGALAAVLRAAELAGDAEAAQSLIDQLDMVADARGDALAGMQLLQARLKHSPTPESRKASLQRLLLLSEHSLGDFAAAHDFALQLLEIDPADAQALEKAAQLAGHAASDSTAADTLANQWESAALRQGAPEIRLAWRRTALRTLGDRPSPQQIRPLLEGILADAPGDSAALTQLDALAEQSGDVQARLTLLTLRIQAAAPEDQPALHLERGQLAESAGLWTEAVDSFAAASALGEADLRQAADLQLVEAADQAGLPLKATAALERLREAEEDEDARAVLTLRLANAWRDGGAAQAALATLQQGYAELPASEPLFSALETELRDQPQAGDLAAHLQGAWQRVQWADPADAEAVAGRWLEALRSGSADSNALLDAAELLAQDGVALTETAALLDEVANAADDEQTASRALAAAAQIRGRLGDVEGEIAARLQRTSYLADAADRQAERRLLAGLFADRLSDPQAALTQWQAILQDRDWSRADGEALLHCAATVGESSAAETQLADALQSVEEPGERRALWLSLATAAETRGDAALAVRWLGLALARHADFDAAAEQYLATLDRWTDAPEGSADGLLQHLRLHASQPDQRANAALRLAKRQLSQGATGPEVEALLGEALAGDAGSAEAVFDCLAETGSTSQVAVAAAELMAARRLDAALWLESLARDAGDQLLLARRLRERAERPALADGDSDAAVSAWLELIDLLSNELGDATAASAALDQALQTYGRDEALLRQQVNLAEKSGDSKAAAKAWGALAGTLEGAAAAQAWLAQGRLQLLHGDQAAALESCELALLADETDLQAHRVRADVLYSQLPGADPAELLRQALGSAQQLDELEDWFDRVVDLVSAGDVEGDAATAVVALAAQTAVDLGQADRGADFWDLLWDQRPEDTQARNAALELRRQARDPARLAAALDRALMFAEPEEITNYKVELAQLKLTNLGRPREALRLVLDLLEQQPDLPQATALAEQLVQNPVCGDEALAALEALYRAAQQWDGLAVVLRQRIDRTHSSATRAELAQALADVLMRGTGPVGAAFDSLWVALQANPQLGTLLAMESAAATAEQKATLAEAFPLVLAGPVRDSERGALLLRHAKLCLEIGQKARAEAQLRAAYDADPLAIEAFELLEQLLDEAGRFDEQLLLLAERADRETDADARRACLNRVAGLGRALGNTSAAIAAYATLAELDPSDVDAVNAWVELLREEGAADALAEGLVQLAAQTEDPHAKAEVYCEAARALARIGDPEGRTEDLYRAAFDADPRMDEAFVWLDKHLHSQPRQLTAVLQLRADALDNGPAKVVILRKLANACRDAADGPGACAALEQAMVADPANTAVLDEWLKTAEAQRVWPSWYRAASMKVAKETRREARLPQLVQMARVAITELDDTVRAQAHAGELSLSAPTDAGARLVLALLGARSGDPQESVAGLEQVLKETDDPRMLLSVHQQLADLYLGTADNPGKGIRELQRIIALDPKRWEVRRRLCDLYRARNSYEALAESLRQWLAAMHDSQERVTLELGRGDALVSLMRELGDVLVLLGQSHEAAQILKKAWDLNGHSVDLDAALAPLLEADGEFTLAAELHDWLVLQLTQDKQRLAYHLSRSALLHERRGDLMGARERFKRALESAPGDDLASLGSARVCLALNEIDRAMRLFDVVAHRQAQDCSAELRADAHFGIGQCRLARMQREQARAAFEQALAVLPGHKAARDALMRL